MVKILISGCNGHMGRVVADICAAEADIEVVGGFDLLGQSGQDFPVWSAPNACTVAADAVIDFSSPAALDGLLEFGKSRPIPLVLATTGYTQEQLDQIDAAAQSIPIFRSANMSLGINVLLDLVRRAAAVLGERFDIEIVERHHNRKVDAPSGTALMIAGAAASALPYQAEYVYDRHTVRQRRGSREIGISAVRGGNIVGDHEIIFAGRDEVIELRHSAMGREVFASGAVRAARFLTTVSKPGLYSMSDLVAEIK
ncbi:4-hydroxy-tetrahydrodipicolinate reductase [Pseudoflavonifractor sp. 524-17]|uniref:4-hydroxy-tetrahydrodipicolinate reductase n=1 Tax=Pseudoflavonifractor sp. 524-17 TaxID=2304577 RepID=UPI00137B383B|nr:4-hydroxy-tetrahydrodipicolinate reductase [Pseudoflavonifractor sp. 524-17]NCE64278.1 4-hydroxy-tetrahydrodipicolinate reductase [Pseudoflavonifractor sp. 524-17]